jgi:hypothetical protein
VILLQVVAIVIAALAVGGGLAVALLSSGGAGIDASLGAGQLLTASLVVLVLALLAATASLRRIRRLDPARVVDLGGSL